MSFAGAVERLWRREEEPWGWKLLLLPLLPWAWLYGALSGWRLRRLAARAHRVSVKVISIGNLSVGGAGKTPVTIALAKHLCKRGERPAVLSRGYGRRPGAEWLVVSDGEHRLVSAEEGGDEPSLIADSCSGVPVLVGADRAALADRAIELFQPTVLLLDDAFQHAKLHRDIDVVVIDASNPFGNGHVMPRGPLRESKSALRRASILWLSKVDQASPEKVERLAAWLEGFTGKRPIRSRLRAVDPDLRGKRILLLAGIARPESFRVTLTDLGAQLVGESCFSDHHAFTESDLASVEARALAAGAEAIALTEKDAIKLPSARPSPLPWVTVRVEAVPLEYPELL